MQHRHRTGPARYSDKVRELLLRLTVSHKTILEPMSHIVLKALVATGLLLDFDCGALDPTLEA